MRLIDADALIEELKWCKGQSTDKDKWDDVIERVTKQPIIDALAMLKEREPVKAEKRLELKEFIVCGYCKSHLLHKFSYCPECGRSVKWE